MPIPRTIFWFEWFALTGFRRGDCVDLISGVLGDKSRVFTTKCCMHELSTLGAEQAGMWCNFCVKVLPSCRSEKLDTFGR